MTDAANRGPTGHSNRDYTRQIREIPANDDGPMWTVRLLSYDDGGASIDDERRDASEQLIDKLLASVDAEGVFFGDVVDQTDGHTPQWHRAGVVKYPTRRSLIALHEDPDFERLRTIERPELRHTLILGCIPSPTMPVPDGMSLPAWSTVPFPASDDDSPVVVMHLVRYADCEWSPDDMATYAAVLARVSIPHGARATRAFAVEGVVFGDGRSWDEVRFTTYPSRAAFLAVINDLHHVEAFERHRRHLIEDKYTLVMRPSIDRIARSIID